jgi:hypothetical protein
MAIEEMKGVFGHFSSLLCGLKIGKFIGDLSLIHFLLYLKFSMLLPQLSVLMTVYNDRVDFLNKAIQSILQQSFHDFELVIVNDGSTSAEPIKSLDQWLLKDSRIRVIHETHRGLTPTLNIGLHHCKAPLVCRHDADDWSLPQRFEKQVQFLRNNPSIGVVGSAIRLCQENDKKLWDQYFPDDPLSVLAKFPQENPFCHGAICFRAKDATAIGGYQEIFTCSQDYDFLWRFCEYTGGTNLPEVLYCHRRNTNSITSRRPVEQAKARALAQASAKQRNNTSLKNLDQQKWETADAICSTPAILMHCAADQQLLSGHYGCALHSYFRAIIASPCILKGYLKAIRGVLFIIFPIIRSKLFGH